jgi:hypothetical protein
MEARLKLHDELTKFLANAYFQPPSNIKMAYPCIVYHKRPKSKEHANDRIYKYMQGYQITVITTDADSTIADDLERHFQYCSINNYFVIDNLHHTILNLYY